MRIYDFVFWIVHHWTWEGNDIVVSTRCNNNIKKCFKLQLRMKYNFINKKKIGRGLLLRSRGQKDDRVRDNVDEYVHVDEFHSYAPEDDDGG